MFKGYYFNSPTVHNQIRVLANGFKVYGISKEAINKLNIKIPSSNAPQANGHNPLRSLHPVPHTEDSSPRRPAPHRQRIPRYGSGDRGARSRCFRSYPLRHKKKKCSSLLEQIEFLAYA